MRRFWIFLMTAAVMGFLFSSTQMAYAYRPQSDQPPSKSAPEYAKWGRIAMEVTAEKYPHAQIVNYLHVGRQKKSPSTTEETFKLWLREGKKEWGVYVRILFETANERVISITSQDTNRSSLPIARS